MATKPLPSAEYLRQCFVYDPGRGSLMWQSSRPREHFKTNTGWLTWSKRYAGKSAGNLDLILGYIDVNLGGKRFYAHRIIWKMMTGEDPIAIIDHRDGDGINNKWSNLRQATKEQNQWNSRAWNKNRQLPRGVWERTNKRKNGDGAIRYAAGASHNNRHVHIGTFDTPEEASAAYRAYIATQRGDFCVE